MFKFLFLFIITFLASLYFQLRVKVPQTPATYLRPPENIKYFTFGYNDAFASLLWIRALQNLDYCEGGKYQESDYVAPDVEEKNKLKAVITRKMKPARCHKGWVYSMLDTLTEIQPHFKIAYETGATFLSVGVDDREGARLLFEKGLKIYPTSWRIAYDAGYHYLWEMQNPERSAELLLQALRHGGPPFLASLSAGLYTENGQVEYAKVILLEQLQNKDLPEEVEKRIRERLSDLEAILKQQKNGNDKQKL